MSQYFGSINNFRFGIQSEFTALDFVVFCLYIKYVCKENTQSVTHLWNDTVVAPITLIVLTQEIDLVCRETCISTVPWVTLLIFDKLKCYLFFFGFSWNCLEYEDKFKTLRNDVSQIACCLSLQFCLKTTTVLNHFYLDYSTFYYIFTFLIATFIISLKLVSLFTILKKYIKFWENFHELHVPQVQMPCLLTNMLSNFNLKYLTLYSTITFSIFNSKF